jgi:predicted ribosomally synthesized peptide with SipW-like signal peptide
MRRSILTSFVVIGAVLALVMGAGTFAVFTDTENITGNTTAGRVDFELSGDDGDDSNVDAQDTGNEEADNDEDLQIYFNSLGDSCVDENEDSFDFFAPGDSCTIDVNLTRDNILQQLAVDLDVNGMTLLGQTAAAGVLTVASACDGGAFVLAEGGWRVTVAFRDDDSDNEDRMPAATPDDDQYLDVMLELVDGTAIDECQGDVINGNAVTPDLSIAILATQAGDPHDTGYD